MEWSRPERRKLGRGFCHEKVNEVKIEIKRVPSRPREVGKNTAFVEILYRL
jgi:hypothetical protein